MDGSQQVAEGGAAVGSLGWKYLVGLAGGAGVGAGLAAFVVMCLSRPKDDREWRVALACTLATSVFGGAGLVRWLGFQTWIFDPVGAVGLVGFVFACGLPGWVLVRALFKWFDKQKDKDLAEIAADVKAQLKE